ncbi:caspase family protein [Spirosoma endophyticum]|uniref:WD40 repeat n=1 Tax=Spirosoma endophyticum TaxID=662367 RepID=A0A1I1MWX3_9BACT|nr:caspase family protein [Spirosoma endophyticum]SFC87063.1 WD40 repeat [Spirosoma endophyticum]
MKDNILLLLLSLLVTRVGAQQLDINTGGHKASVRQVLTTLDGKYLLSAGEDKTIKLWNAQTGNVAEEIRGQTGADNAGKIYTLALSPDNKLLAAGGWLGSAPDSVGIIRIYDFPSRKLIGLLQGVHRDVVLTLAFTSDGQELISGAADQTVAIWSMKTRKLVRSLVGHTSEVRGVCTFGDRIVSVGQDQKICLWRKSDGKLLRRSDGKATLESVVYSPALARILVGNADGELLVLDNQLTERQRIQNGTVPLGLAVSPNGQRVICGIYGGNAASNVYQSLRDTTFVKIATFGKNLNTAKAVAFLSNDMIVTAGGYNQELLVWQANDKGGGKLLSELGGKGRINWGVGLNGTRIGYANTYTDERGQSTLTSVFDWKNQGITAVTPVEKFGQLPVASGDYSLVTDSDGTGEAKLLTLMHKGKAVATIRRDDTDGFRHNVWGFLPDGKLFLSGGAKGVLKAYNLKGQEVAQLRGHQDEIWGLGASADGKRLVSGSADQTIRIWNTASFLTSKLTEPLASLFIGTDGEWVMWHPTGYYDASPDGEKYIGWLVNRGALSNADYYPVANYREAFYNPELIQKVLETGNLEASLVAVNEKRRDIKAMSPPQFRWIEPTAEVVVSTELFTLRAEVLSETAVDQIKVLLNGRPVAEERGLKTGSTAKATAVERTIKLLEGDNELRIFAKNKDAEALSERKLITYVPAVKKAINNRTLYVLAIGISKYNDPSVSLHYADKDADALSASLLGQKGGLFNEVKVTTLTNEKATAREIRKALQKLTRDVTQNDMAIISIASHGVNGTGKDFYIVPSDVELDNLEATAIRDEDIRHSIENMPCKVLVFLDACHSGSFGKTQVATRALTTSMDEVVRDFTSAGVGATVFASSTGNEKSQESDEWKHGAFTKALLDGLDGKADYDHNGVIYTKELDAYITQRVKELTGGTQHPRTYNTADINDFPIYIIK